MENASKALIMAGGVLIALMILAALLLMFNNLSNYQGADTQNIKEQQILEFNKQYETYNRNNVRGSDIYSLLNKVIDYNRRKSTEGTGNDQGQYIAYEPMTIIFEIDMKELSIDPTRNYLFGSRLNAIKSGNKYEVSKNRNNFEDIYNDIKVLENKYGQDSLTKLAGNITGIFLEGNSLSETEKSQAITKFNNVSRKVTIANWNEIAEGTTIREDVYKYYEYIQFKRARFDCKSVEYNQKSGRIVKMEFKFNGNFN